jgi:1-phosphofructokinase family hexose kinase
MIYTITFNPALDLSGFVEYLSPNEKNYVHDEIYSPGGNGINSGLIAQRLNSKVLLTGFLGGANGEEIKSKLNALHVKHDFIKISGSTRMNITISNNKTHQQTRLSFPGPKIKNVEKNHLFLMLKKLSSHDLVILGGSLPPGISVSFVLRLIKFIKSRNAFCMVDMPGKVIKDLIKARPDFIKPNLTEFQEIIGKKVTSIRSSIIQVKKLLNDVPMICLSSVEGGALFLTTKEIWYGKLPPVKIRSTVGAGDSMVGAMANRIESGRSFTCEELLRIGLSASCATLTEKGATLGTKKSILNYYPKILIKKIS